MTISQYYILYFTIISHLQNLPPAVSEDAWQKKSSAFQHANDFFVYVCISLSAIISSGRNLQTLQRTHPA